MSETDFKEDLRKSKNEFISEYMAIFTPKYNEMLVEKYLNARYAWLHNKGTWKACHAAFVAMKNGEVSA
jgi:hypothetical protein